MIVIVGLGNPGRDYEKTVHNLGYMCVDYFAENFGLNFTKSKYMGKVAEGMVDGEKVILLKPETFMNLSGKSVEDIVHKLKLDLHHVLICVDDIDLDFGHLRVRTKGSAGTHNGLRDIVQKVGEDFPRLRIGAGRPAPHQDLANFVLSNFPNDKLNELKSTFDKTNKVLKYFITNKTIEGLDVNKL